MAVTRRRPITAADPFGLGTGALTSTPTTNTTAQPRAGTSTGLGTGTLTPTPTNFTGGGTVTGYGPVIPQPPSPGPGYVWHEDTRTWVMPQPGVQAPSSGSGSDDRYRYSGGGGGGGPTGLNFSLQSIDPAALAALGMSGSGGGGGAPGASPVAAPVVAPTPSRAYTAEETAAMDPGTAAANGIGWVPRDHPSYGQPGYVGSAIAGPAAAPGASTGTPGTGTPGANPGTAPDSIGAQVRGVLATILNNNGKPNAQRITDRTESARETIENARTAMTDQGRAELAARGLISVPGGSQGAEGGLVRRITENLGGQYATALRDIVTEESQLADQQLATALTVGAGLSQQDADLYIAEMNNATQRYGIDTGAATSKYGTDVNAATQRQGIQTNWAIEQLSNNRQWNQFLAGYGLDRDRFLYEAQNGGLNNLMPILSAFLGLANTSAGGYT